MTSFLDLPNEVLAIILFYLDPFTDFPSIVFIPYFKPLIYSSLCVLTDDIRFKKQSSLPTYHLADYYDIIYNHQNFIINVHAPIGEAFLVKIVNSMIMHRKPHIINLHTKLSPRGLFNQGLFNGNVYTRRIKMFKCETLGSASVFEKFYDLMSFNIEAPHLKTLYADFANRKSFLTNFNLPKLENLAVRSSHLSANCIRKFENLKTLTINSFSDLEDLTLPHLEQILLTSEHSLMLSNCNFPKLKQFDVAVEARLPGIINCQLDSLNLLSINNTKTSFMKGLQCSNMQFLYLVDTIPGVLDTLVFEGGYFPELLHLTVPSPVYLSNFQHCHKLSRLFVSIQKDSFFPTIPMNIRKEDDDDYKELTMDDELQILSEVNLTQVRELSILIETLPRPLAAKYLKLPNILSGMPNLDSLRFFVQYTELDPKPNEIFFDMSFLKTQRLTHLYTNIAHSQIVGIDPYSIEFFQQQSMECGFY